MADKESLSYDLKVVSASRFLASTRIRREADFKRFLINFISAISILIGAIIISSGDHDFNKILAVNLIGISVFSMWVSLDKSVPDLYASSHRLYISAVKINNALKDLKFEKNTLEFTREEYSQILASDLINHDDTDQQLAVANISRKSPGNAVDAFIKNANFSLLKAKHYLLSYKLFGVLAVWMTIIIALSFYINYPFKIVEVLGAQ